MNWGYRSLIRQYCLGWMTFEFGSAGNLGNVSHQIMGPLSLTSLNEKWRWAPRGRWAWKEFR